MKGLIRHILATTLALLAAAVLPGAAALAGDTCADNTAIPPFLSGGVPPNLLLVIDNSASMYDLAYVDEADPGACYDGIDLATGQESYNATRSYAGYFDRVDDAGNTQWYAYNATSQQFERKTAAEADALCTTAVGTRYDKAGTLCLKINETLTPHKMTAFAATGNFLNWAAASKLDVEKRILTGGKYDAANHQLVMESRGCLERRMIKQVAVTQGVTTYYLALGVRPPREPYPLWKAGTAYTAGDIVKSVGSLYKATTSGTSASNATSALDDTGVTWTEYTLGRWADNVAYPAGTLVSDIGSSGTYDLYHMYYTPTGGTSHGTNPEDDTGVDWILYTETQIEVFQPKTNGFDTSACDEAIDLLEAGGSQGQIKSDIDACMAYDNATSTYATLSGYMNAPFNHSVQNCWYLAKHGVWPPGAGSVTAAQNDCEKLYALIDPWDITPDYPGYVCFGIYQDVNGTVTQYGYVGRCWNAVSSNATLTCTKYHPKHPGDPAYCQKWEVTGSTSSGTWIPDSDNCVDQALRDFCGAMEIPDVVDPTDQAGSTGEFWNLPAMLTDYGVTAQLSSPIAVMRGRIAQPSPPTTGVIREFSRAIRIGVMAFNDEGSDTECNASDPYILYDCTNPKNQDGAEVLAYIDMDTGNATTHTAALVQAINDIKATTWTPLAEALYNALGYYGQNATRRLNSGFGVEDFLVDASHPDPVLAYCQSNNILLITDGASTADQAAAMRAFAALAGHNDGDADPAACGSLDGSSLLDDLAWFGKHGDPLDLYANPWYTDESGNPVTKKNISTYIVVAGSQRSDNSTGECNPLVQLTAAAANGGTTLYQATDVSALETQLRNVFTDIAARAASGTAASVISASRGGEGAVFQAMFWTRKLDNQSPRNEVRWVGDVHSLFLGATGGIFEDTNGDDALDPAADRQVTLYFDSALQRARACYGGLNATAGTCTNATEIENVHFLWSAADWLAGISDADITANRATYLSGTPKRYIFTWEDLNADGVVDSGEVLPFDQNLPAAFGVSASRGPISQDFGVKTNAEAIDIINWIRGANVTGFRNRTLVEGGAPKVYRLGDVVHSTPMVVAAPAESYALLYDDLSYARFYRHYKNRRQMVYFGANDGMLHAVNGGFFDPTTRKFCRDANCSGAAGAPELGQEMWAYVPYNLLPYLKCLTDPDYQHRYFVDLRPRIFDAKIFPDDADHPGGWGTLLVGGMRLGGGTLKAADLDLAVDGSLDYASDDRTFVSAYFILDITNPEKPPTLLAEMTDTTTGSEAPMGFTTAIPTVVPMRQDTNTTEWTLVLGSGPTNMYGESTQKGRVCTFPLNGLAGTPRAFRLPAAPPSFANEAGCFELDDKSFVSDLITVDFDLRHDPLYKADAVYFGTVIGDSAPGQGGKLYRLITRRLAADGTQELTHPHEWAGLRSPNPAVLIDAGRPITAAPAVGTDGQNYWIYVGTGRYFDALVDKNDNTTQYEFGIMEPTNATTGRLTWEQVEFGPAGFLPQPRGSRGLQRVDQIQVALATSPALASLCCSASENFLDAANASICSANDTSCLPDRVAPLAGKVNNFGELKDYILSYRDGWYREMTIPRERNLGQAALLGGLLLYTTYQPIDNVCLPEGYSYLYALYYQTGTAWFKNIFADLQGATHGASSRNLGRGMALTPSLHTGKSEGSKAFVQTSTGAILEIETPELPLKNVHSGRVNWREMTDE
ncbi:hypothetical protein G3N55_07690 [Dissulfurirhabdus thermomarina]|uniref:PilY1 beta-propeller domain-containing protein n=1 Tax=Dissulfurirhabdus thermomarina TaxID=1765737 RepID=A0A6N9TN51_DISTH|nr:PilC/PilY family type IV pilus protein [Dissulfurirhabdus thermomarina]NDY42721.1 hypothetical protein [Dissulfurirhabdus thermomarina]NMX23633.1 hypothetical protein [Dissulfurirhabdus thermomarina]